MLRRAAVLLLAACADAAQILLSGDSWTGGSRQFIDTFSRHGDARTIQNIGAGGSTCAGWASGNLLNRLVTAVQAPDVEHVWMICGGNDALGGLLGCTPQDQCVDRLIASMRANLNTIATAVHAANPRVKISGFGYDQFPFGALHCNVMSIGLFPACLGDAACVNHEFYKFQGLYDEMARTHANFDSTNILGALQAAEGVPGASIGHPVDTQFAPTNTYAFDCIHPNAHGYSIIFEAYYQQYWAHNRRAAGANATVAAGRDHYQPEKAHGEHTDALLWKHFLAGLKRNATRH